MASIHAYQTAKGERRYDVRYRDQGGNQRSRVFTVRKDAQAFKLDVERRRQAGVLYQATPELFSAVAGAEDSWDKRPTDVKPQYPTLPKHETPRFYGAHKAPVQQNLGAGRANAPRPRRAARLTGGPPGCGRCLRARVKEYPAPRLSSVPLGRISITPEVEESRRPRRRAQGADVRPRYRGSRSIRWARLADRLPSTHRGPICSSPPMQPRRCDTRVGGAAPPRRELLGVAMNGRG